ncbi:hypothetical protein C0Q70_08884 [Pomacea canaliculata]|uniref:Laminin G domain-containing protein n=1 Tax=Pomacea canaliculata TaxID=400727 RepID=A0A2T7P893_POMCA|nr:uncharacterized protein LOC112563546 [Pomacea canaliculata]PVD29629.1 hypothetical protein C0Q70_08884 [Pomacea canaliculata]
MYCFVLLLGLMALVDAKKEPCFHFPGEAYLRYGPGRFNISDEARYNLTFRTSAASGIILYVEGPDDYEVLFLRRGRLIYLLTNPTPSGVEGTSGGLYESNAAVNNNTWVRVELLRNWGLRKRSRVGTSGRNTPLQTGMILHDLERNTEEVHLDNLNHQGVLLHPDIYIGGIGVDVRHIRPGSSAVTPFVGEVKDMSEVRNGLTFEFPFLNYENRVKECVA